MKIRRKGINNLPLITWFDEDIGPARVGLDVALEFVSYGFQSPNGSGPNSDDTMTVGLNLAKKIYFIIFIIFS